MTLSFVSYFLGPRIYAHKRDRDVNGWFLGSLESIFSSIFSRQFVGIILCLFSLKSQYLLPAVKFYSVTTFLLFSLRGVLRFFNEKYRVFISGHRRFDNETVIMSYNELIKDEDFAQLQDYDYEVSYIPSQYICVNRKRDVDYRSSIMDIFPFLLNRFISKNFTFPGSCSISKVMLSSILKSGRAQLLGKEFFRMVLTLQDGLRIDTMFVDRRNSGVNSEYLVITCEGNLSFYETGIFRQVLSSVNHSVLGWNYPGYSESMGIPYANNVKISIFAVLKYAINFLLFPANKIIIVGWSIGGFSAIAAAVEFQKIKGMIVDASFTSTMIFAKNLFPTYRSHIKKIYSRDFDLNNKNNIRRYNGKVVMIARARDKIMQLSPTINGEKDWNRSYNVSFKLALKTLMYRYPKIFVEETVSLIKSSVNEWTIEPNPQGMIKANKILEEEFKSNKIFPSDFGSSSMSEEKRFETAKNLVDSMVYWHHGEHQTCISYAPFIDILTES